VAESKTINVGLFYIGFALTAACTSSQSPASVNEDDIQLPPEPPGNCSKRLQVYKFSFLNTWWILNFWSVIAYVLLQSLM